MLSFAGAGADSCVNLRTLPKIFAAKEIIYVNTTKINRSLPEGSPAWLHSRYFVPLALLAIVLILLGGPLSQSGILAANGGTDLAAYFAYCREFGAQQMRHGHIPLWNPHILGGTPFVGNWQSALWYPLNWTYLVLPLDKAINLEIALHVWLMGCFTALWASRWKVHPLAQVLAGTMTMCGGPYYLHCYAGHLPILDACAWLPLMLYAADNLLTRPAARWAMLGALAFGMQILAGHPQSVFHSLVTLALYTAFCLPGAKEKARSALLLGMAVLGGIALSAVQLLTGLQAAGEGVRQGAIPEKFVGLFSFPPNNFRTLLIPGFYGDMTHMNYWGSWFLWEVSLFVGVTGVLLASYSLTAARQGGGRRGVWAAMTLCLLVLALSANTPLFPLLYRFLPGFNKFRGHSKFVIEASLFLAMLAANGLDSILKAPRRVVPLAIVTGVLALFIGGYGALLRLGDGTYGDPAFWTQTLNSIDALHDSETRYTPSEVYKDTKFFNESREFTGAQCLLCAGVLIVIAGLFAIAPRWRGAGYALALLGLVELIWFAKSETDTFKLADTRNAKLEQFFAERPGDYRTMLVAFRANLAQVADFNDLTGYEPAIVGRYAELLKRTQNADPNDGEAEVRISRLHPLFRLLRCVYIFAPNGQGGAGMQDMKNPLPQMLLVDNAQIQTSRNAIFDAMNRPDFKPEDTVILEAPPVPAPVPAADRGTVRLVSSTTDSLTMDVQTAHPTLLLITDTYSKWWQATALPGSSQQAYTVQPGDYAFRVIPLGAGQHHILLSYAPSGYTFGLWISLISAGVFAVLWIPLRKSVGQEEPLPAKIQAPEPELVAVAPADHRDAPQSTDLENTDPEN